MRRDETLSILLETKVVAVIRMSDAAKLRKVTEAIGRGGVRAIEITMTTPGALEAIRELAAAREPGALVGAGTVLDADTAEAAVRAGADFVVSPVTDFETIRRCRKLDTVVCPGAFSPTEILAAWRAGADIVKVFPATSLGPKFFRDVRGPLPEIRLMPTGGVSIENAADFIAAGACCVGIGTALLDAKAIADEAWDVLTERARRLTISLQPE